MQDKRNPGLEKLAEEPYEKIREYELKTRKLKDGDAVRKLIREKRLTKEELNILKDVEWGLHG